MILDEGSMKVLKTSAMFRVERDRNYSSAISLRRIAKAYQFSWSVTIFQEPDFRARCVDCHGLTEVFKGSFSTVKRCMHVGCSNSSWLEGADVELITNDDRTFVLGDT